MALTVSQQNSIANDINEILERNGVYFKNALLKVNPRDLQELSVDYVFEQNVFKQYFTSLSAAKMDSIYTYKNFPFVLDMLKNDELHFTSLKLNEPNDSSEYLETMLRCMYINPFFAEDYVNPKMKINGTNPYYFKSANGCPLPVEQMRKETYICCFTNTYNLNRHWVEYAKDESGVCVEMSFQMPHPNKYTWLSYGRIDYDSGYDFDFLKEINLMMIRKYGKTFTPQGMRKLAVMVKRDRYRWEDELRIALINNSSEFDKMIFSEDPNVSGLVKVKNGMYFNWTIKKVVAGNKIDQNNLKQLQSICNYRNIPLVY